MNGKAAATRDITEKHGYMAIEDFSYISWIFQ